MKTNNKNDKLIIPKAVNGAAKYIAVGNEVAMIVDGENTIIDRRSNPEAALKCAISWQKKENRVVLKSQGII